MAGFVVAVTGGVASGKSAVTAIFEKCGVTVVDADIAARQVVGEGQPALSEIARRFGAGVMLPDGSLDRVRMRELVFEDPLARRDLESITHPPIRALLKSECVAAPGAYAIVAIPLLAETGSIAAYAWLNRILVVDTPVLLQRARLMARDGVDEALALRMINAQASRPKRLAIASDVVINDGLIGELFEPTRRLHALYSSMALARLTPPGQS
ncbi:MAG: dephospho-CoA kinase [Gammaproteobacteria bacterium RIFCSPHIGHO2_12_FULL_63_22]|nr:MAG: dephospho-CoA kinase [Gammaproteobacteria bacterium RIFCSPHIGHO2_12_FULL_63_22]